MNIYEIAEKCGVSIATISRVLNNSPKVSVRTRDHVLEVMKKEEYSPNIFARGLGLGTMKMVGVLCTDVRGAFYSEAVALIEEELRKKGLDTILCCTGNELSEKKRRIKEMVQKKVDAIILIGSVFREDTDNSHIEYAAQRLPVILLNGEIDIPSVYCISCDESKAMSNAVKELVKRGCKQVLYLYDQPNYSGNKKLSGYSEGIKRYSPKASYDLHYMVTRDMTQIKEMVLDLIDKGVQFDSVLTSEDIIAISVMQALQSRNLSYPVIGCNNSMLCDCCTPTLSSIDNRLRDMCMAAVDILDKLDEKQSPANKTIFDAILVKRDSTNTKNNTKTNAKTDTKA